MAEIKKKHRYRHSGGKQLIEVRIKNTTQLFDVRDPSPFHERDLDDDFVEYVMASVREFSNATPLKIVIYVEEAERPELSREIICESIRSYFVYRTDLQRGDLKTFMRRAQLFLAIGLAILVACISISQNLQVPEPPGAIGVLREGVVIFGWVSIWKPIELILFDWYPLYQRLRLYKKLLATEIEVLFTARS